MANKFPIDITAQDKFSAVFDKLNKSVANMTRPVNELAKSTKTLAEKSGLNEISKSFGELRSVASEAGRELGLLAGPMSLLGGGATIAGIAAMADKWGAVGVSLTNVSAASGVAASSLSRMQSAARLAGASADAVTSSMQGLAEITNDATLGRNNLALATLNQLNIHLARTKDGLVDTRKEFLDLLDAIAAQPNPQAQNLIARNMGIDPSLLTADVRKRGAAAWTEREEKAKKRGDSLTPGQVKDANELSESIDSLKSSVSGAWNGVMDDIGGTIKTVIDSVDDWIVNNGTAAKRMIESSLSAGGASALVNAGSIFTRPLVGVAGGLGAGAVGGLAAAGITFDYFEDAKRINDQIKQLGGFVDESGQFHPIDTSAADADDTGKLIQIPASPSASFSAAPSPTGSSLGMRSNNPGNLQPGGHEASFTSMHDGLKAAAENILAYNDKYGMNTISDIVSRWAPPGQNDTASYISDVSRRTGFAPQEKLDVHNPQVLEALVNAIAHHENGTDAASHTQLAEAIADALSRKPMAIRIELAGAPAGTRVTATDNAGNAVPVRVNVRMPLSPSP